MKSPEQRGPIGAWIRQQRLARGWSQAQAVKELSDAGHSMAETTYRLFESGNRRPGPESLAAFEALFGEAAPSPETGSPAELIKAMYAQTEAINRLVEAITQDRSSSAKQRAENARTIAKVVADALAAREDARRATGSRTQARGASGRQTGEPQGAGVP